MSWRERFEASAWYPVVVGLILAVGLVCAWLVNQP